MGIAHKQALLSNANHVNHESWKVIQRYYNWMPAANYWYSGWDFRFNKVRRISAPGSDD